MKKLLILFALLLSLTVLFVACNDGNEEVTGTEADGSEAAPTEVAATDAPTEAPTAAPEQPTDAPEQPTDAPEQPTDAPEQPTDAPEQPTEEATEASVEPDYYMRDDAAVALKGFSFDTFKVNGAMYFETDGHSDRKLADIDNTVVFEIGAVHDSVTFRGWVGFEQPLYKFGYVIEGGKNIFGDFAAETEDGVKAAGGENASRFEITVPIANKDAGSYKIAAIVKLADGKIVKLYEITVVIKAYEVDASMKFHCCVDYVMNAGPDGQPYYQNLGASTINSDGSFPEATGFNPLGEDFILSVQGWNALDGGVAKYVWSVDGKQWFDCVDLGTHDGMPLENYFEQIGIPGAPATNAMYVVGADMTAFNGQTVDVYFAAVSVANEGKLEPMVKVVGVTVPKIVTDIEFTFKTDVENQAVGTDFQSSDLADFFSFQYGLSEPHAVAENENGKFYSFAGINEMFADIDGKNAYTVDILSSEQAAMMFCRGVRACHPTDTTGIQFILNNYYETDGLNYMGGAGIWGRITNGVLTIFIKYYNTEKTERIGNAEFTYNVTGTKLTFADDGKDVWILVDGQLITKVTLTGSVTYDDMTFSPDNFTFAQKAEIITADGTVAAVENTLVTTIPSQIGIAVRPHTINFKSIEVAPFSTVKLPTDNTNLFRSNVDNYAAGTDFRDSDLASFFTINYGLSEPHAVAENENGKYYAFAGINELYADVNGRNNFELDILSNETAALSFVRGVKVCHPVDTTDIQFIINNYYETDGLGLMGGAGIYANLNGTTLTVYVKAYDAAAAARIADKTYTFEVSGTKLTYADDGNKVTILVDGQVITTVTLSGEVTYDDMVTDTDLPFAAKAEIVLADGTVETIENTLVASAPSQVGVAVRPNAICFRSIAVNPYAV